MYGVSGRTAYTKSVTAILTSVLYPNSAPAPAQSDKTHNKGNLQNNYNVKVNNVFDVLGN